MDEAVAAEEVGQGRPTRGLRTRACPQTGRVQSRRGVGRRAAPDLRCRPGPALFGRGRWGQPARGPVPDEYDALVLEDRTRRYSGFAEPFKGAVPAGVGNPGPGLPITRPSIDGRGRFNVPKRCRQSNLTLDLG